MRTTKQNAVMAFLRQHGQMTLSEAVELIGGNVYCNERFHVGNVLSRMVKRGMIVRVKPGVFCLALAEIAAAKEEFKLGACHAD